MPIRTWKTNPHTNCYECTLQEEGLREKVKLGSVRLEVDVVIEVDVVTETQGPH